MEINVWEPHTDTERKSKNGKHFIAAHSELLFNVFSTASLSIAPIVIRILVDYITV